MCLCQRQRATSIAQSTSAFDFMSHVCVSSVAFLPAFLPSTTTGLSLVSQRREPASTGVLRRCIDAYQDSGQGPRPTVGSRYKLCLTLRLVACAWCVSVFLCECACLCVLIETYYNAACVLIVHFMCDVVCYHSPNHLIIK
jgi:hypothetical protein